MTKNNKLNMDGKKLLLSLLYSPGKTKEINERIIGRTRLTKMVFLFEKEVEKKFMKNIKIDNYQFEPYYYGPFCRTLIDDLSFFISIGMIEVEETDILAGYEEIEDIFEEDEDNNEIRTPYEKAYKLSKIGVNYVEEKIWKIYSKEQKETLNTFKSKINEISLDSLLNYVYNKYPEQTIKSVIADKYIKENKTC